MEQVDGVDIRVTVGDNLGQTHTLLAAGVLGTSGWTRLAITYKFDEVDLKVGHAELIISGSINVTLAILVVLIVGIFDSARSQ